MEIFLSSPSPSQDKWRRLVQHLLNTVLYNTISIVISDLYNDKKQYVVYNIASNLADEMSKQIEKLYLTEVINAKLSDETKQDGETEQDV